jgi:hypothetical protein
LLIPDPVVLAALAVLVVLAAVVEVVLPAPVLLELLDANPVPDEVAFDPVAWLDDAPPAPWALEGPLPCAADSVSSPPPAALDAAGTNFELHAGPTATANAGKKNNEIQAFFT